MVIAREESGPIVNETENIIQECRDRIKQALEADTNKLKQKAELDSNQIIAGAKEEAERIIAQAKEEAAAESEQIVAGAKEKAGHITRKALEEADEARQTSGKVISETREKAWQIITEVIERGTSQAQTEFARAVSEARSKTSMLLMQVNKGVEQIINETDANIKTELERLAAVISEAESKLQPLSEVPTQAAEPDSAPALPEPAAAAETVDEKNKSVIPAIGNKRSPPVKESDNPKLFKGNVKLEMVHPYNQEHAGGVPEWLARHTGLDVTSNGGHFAGNRRITTYALNPEQPIPLLKIIKNNPCVKDACEQKGNIVITLK